MDHKSLTGLQASYRFADALALSGGVANTDYSGINNRNTDHNDLVGSAWHKAYFGLAPLTAPATWEWVAGSKFSAGVIYGPATASNRLFDSIAGFMGGIQINYYAGLTLNTPCPKLTGGVAVDYVRNFNGGYEEFPGTIEDEDVCAADLYLSYQATDKLSFHARGEYEEGDQYQGAAQTHVFSSHVEILTGTVEYDLWANVISRAEVRWSDSSIAVPDTAPHNAVSLFANLVFKF